MNEKIKDEDKDLYVPVTSTFCRGCVFADYDGNVQIGCKANRLEKFKDAGITITKFNTESDKEEEEEIESFIVEGKTCVYYRNKILKDTIFKENSNEEILTTVKKQLRIPYHVLLFMRETDTLDDLELRISELHNQSVKPKIITVVDRSHTVENKSGKVMNIFKDYSFDHWRIQRIKATDQIDTDIIDLVYDSTKKLTYMFYITLECSTAIPLTMSEEIHKSLHDDMKSFSVLLPNSNNIGRGALKAAHAKHAGNSFAILLEDKIKHFDDSPHLIKKVEEICPSLQTS